MEYQRLSTAQYELAKKWFAANVLKKHPAAEIEATGANKNKICIVSHVNGKKERYTIPLKNFSTDSNGLLQFESSISLMNILKEEPALDTDTGHEDLKADDKDGPDKDPESEKEQPKSSGPEPAKVKFNGGRVRQYNKVPFTSNDGYVNKVAKDGVYVTVDNNKVIFVNQHDIIEEHVKLKQLLGTINK